MIPTISQLANRKKIAEEKKLNLQAAYKRFLEEWEKIEREESHLLKDIHNFVDDIKLKVISQKISNIKNTSNI